MKDKRRVRGTKGVYACSGCAVRAVKGQEVCHSCRSMAKPVYIQSTGEYKRWLDLRLLERAGAISHLKRQVKFPIYINGIKVFTWHSDFGYIENNESIVEDFKGWDTDMSKLRRKMVEAYYGIEILVTRKR